MTRSSTSSTSAMRSCISRSLPAPSPEMVRPLTLSPAVDWLAHDTNFVTDSSFRPLNRSLTGEITRSSTSSPSAMRSCISRSLPAPSPEMVRPLMTPSPGMVRSSMTPSPAVDWLPHDTTGSLEIEYVWHCVHLSYIENLQLKTDQKNLFTSLMELYFSYQSNEDKGHLQLCCDVVTTSNDGNKLRHKLRCANVVWIVVSTCLGSPHNYVVPT
ncbi:unnamed protein product [Mytilus coruscus]|uniref:Uncharacterized protein n=1 Tax=Mytilus coruscus TaxID=42192 RepID=A0A6J8CJT2_MYTCO|nr:unnamed protein product [Mytilus coruscus]